MKKFVSFLLILVVLVSCEADVKFNNPAFQGRKDNFLWRATLTQSTVANGVLTIVAYRDLEVVKLVVPAPTTSIVSTAPLKYTFGVDDAIFAAFSFKDKGIVSNYSTAEDIGNGEFVINEYDATTKKLSGTFRFNAIYEGDDPTIAKNLNFQDGFIYQIQVQ